MKKTQINIQNKKTLILRLDLNVPIKNKTILETERIDINLNNLKKYLKTYEVVLLSHLSQGKKNLSLNIVENYIRKKLNKLENKNLKFHKNVRLVIGETFPVKSAEFKKASEYFAGLGDVYINDAFSVSHRDHASLLGVPLVFKKNKNLNYDSGSNLQKEVDILDQNLNSIKKNKNENLIILSGAKISSKLPLIEKFLKLDNYVFVAGAIANQIFKDLLNLNIGKSSFDKDFLFTKKNKNFFLKKIKEKKLILPIDFMDQN